MRLAPNRFNAFLARIGQRVVWRRAILCPCRDPHSGAATPGCPVCHGLGTFWRDGEVAHVAVTAQKVAREWRDFGEYESGDEVLTIPSDSPAYAAGESDQFIMLDSTAPYAASFTRGAPDERLPPHLLTVEEVVAIERGEPVLLSAPRVSLAGGAPVWPTLRPTLHLDFHANAYAMGRHDPYPLPVPAIGQQYSIRGTRRPIYFLFRQFPQDRAHHGGAALPRRVIARRFDLFGRAAG